VSIKLSKRLKTLTTFLSKGTYFADIGTDHAYLPCYVCLNDQDALAIAGEVSKGPYQRAKETVEKYHLTNKVDVRLGSGLQVLNGQTDHIQELVIAGMGGSLMTDILNDGLTKLASVHRLILQPNIGAKYVREWLYKHNYAIVAETIVEENNHLYEVIVAQPQLEQPYTLANEHRAKQMMFGPLLLKEKSNLFYKKWSNELKHLQRIYKQMKQANQSNPRLDIFLEQIRWIEEVLADE